MIDLSSLYSPANRTRCLLGGGGLIVAIALLDLATPQVPLGFLYLFPVLLMAGFISRGEIVGIAAICAVFSSVFSDYHLAEALSFSVMSWAGFSVPDCS